MKASYHRYDLQFKRPSGTSRGILNVKETWFIIIEKDGKKGIGECGLLRGLSIDDRPDYEEKLNWVCQNITLGETALWEAMREFPSIQFGIEMVFLSVKSVNPFLLFPSEFTKGLKNIPINGLVWMGTPDYMLEQIQSKIKEGFSCIKLKIGAINFKEEIKLIDYIRQHIPPEKMEIRVDANGAFDSNDALNKINQLFGYKIHSIEQPIAKNQYDSMAALCKDTPLPIALDEELIGIFDYKDFKAPEPFIPESIGHHKEW
ncbi:MAG: o-succinylbenzoate synthase, partial [Chitinophagaceae bacterium]